MPELNAGELFLETNLNYTPLFQTWHKNRHFISVQILHILSGLFFGLLKNWKCFKFSARIQLYFPIDLFKRVCFKKYALLLTKVWCTKTCAGQKPYLLASHIPQYIADVKDPQPLWILGSLYFLPFNRTTVNLHVLLFRGGLLDQKKYSVTTL